MIIRVVLSSIDSLFRKLRRKKAFELVSPLLKGHETTRENRKQPRLPAEEPATVEWYDTNGVCKSEKVTICDSSPDGLGMQVHQDFPKGQTVWVETEPDKIVKAVVRHSSTQGSGFFAGAIRIQHERRRVDRNPVGGEAVLHWGASNGERRSAPVVVRDASEFGLQLESPLPVPAPGVAKLEGQSLQCVGSTCYCRQEGDHYVVGMHLVRQPYSKNSLDYKDE